MEQKRKLTIAKGAAIVAALPFLLWAYEYGPDPGFSGVPNENQGQTCANSGCHVGTANTGKGSIAVAFPNGLTYSPGVKQRLTVTISDPATTQVSWGFELTARVAATPSIMAGTFASADANTQLVCSQPNLQVFVDVPPASGCSASETLQYMEHSQTGWNNSRGHTGSYSYQFDWTPPASSVGNIRFYVAANAAGTVVVSAGNPNPNDHIYATTFTLTPAAAAFNCTNTTPPTISSIDSASAYGGYNYFASGTWLEIKGTNLADPADPRLSAATNPGQWTSADFNGVNAPTTLDGISVSVNGKPAYVWYLSPTQINVQAPEDTATGNVGITVTNCKATSTQTIFNRQALAPGFLSPTNYAAGGHQYLVATFTDLVTYVLNTSTGASFGLNSRPAKPGDIIVAYGVGFGDVTPSTLPGVVASGTTTLVNPITVSFGSTPATVDYQGLYAGFVGLYEFYITVPSGLANGDYQINVKQNGVAVPQTMYLTVQN